MKLSKQERIAAIVVLIILIIGLGGWLFVKPKIDNIITTNKTLDSKQQEYNAAVEKSQRKEPLRNDIIAAYKKGEHMADMFFPELKSYEADAAFREFLAQCKSRVVVESLQVGEPTTATLGTQFYASNEVTYALKTYATQGAEPSVKEILRDARQLLLLTKLGTAQTIGASTVSFTVSAYTQEDLLKFVDEINHYVKVENGEEVRKAIKIDGLTLEYKDIAEEYGALVKEKQSTMVTDGKSAYVAANPGKKTDSENNQQGTDPNGGSAQASENDNIVTAPPLFTWSDTMTFYCIERMQDPTPQLDMQDGKIS